MRDNIRQYRDDCKDDDDDFDDFDRDLRAIEGHELAFVPGQPKLIEFPEPVPVFELNPATSRGMAAVASVGLAAVLMRLLTILSRVPVVP